MTDRALDELLEDRRDAVGALPGVIGTAVGASLYSSAAGASVIHVYVALGVDAGRARADAKRLLDGAPVEVIEMEAPEAQPD